MGAEGEMRFQPMQNKGGKDEFEKDDRSYIKRGSRRQNSTLIGLIEWDDVYR